MREASKTRAVRPPKFYDLYMSGRVLDIGCGDDLCVPHAVPFDQAEGDANDILRHFETESFDCVHSSHCLEHTPDPIHCLKEWWALVKPGAFLVTVVPDEDYYEQGNWPSRFNPDHKCTFRLEGSRSWSPVSYCLPDLVAALPGARILSAKRQLDGYTGEWVLSARKPLTGRIHRKVNAIPAVPGLKARAGDRLARILREAGLRGTLAERLFINVSLMIGNQVDQTPGTALAQIEVVAQKVNEEGNRKAEMVLQNMGADCAA
jgi:SAM-dependent methyltransferase